MATLNMTETNDLRNAIGIMQEASNTLKAIAEQKGPITQEDRDELSRLSIVLKKQRKVVFDIWSKKGRFSG